MEFRMPFLTLKRLSLMKTSSCLVNHFWRNVLQSDQNWRSNMNSSEWWTSFLNDMSVVDVLMPITLECFELKEVISDMWLHMRLVLIDWLDFVGLHRNYPELEIATLKILYFKNSGVLDMVKMETEGLKYVMMREGSNAKLNFKFATLFYLDEMVMEVYKKMTREERADMYETFHELDNVGDISWYELLFENHLDETWFTGLFLLCMRQKNLNKLFYLWSKMRDNKKMEISLKIAPFLVGKFKVSELMWEVLRYIPPTEMEHFINTYKDGVLASLLDWPYDEMFLPMSVIWWDYLSISDCFYLLRQIIGKCGSGFSKPKFILREFWHRCITLKKDILCDGELFRELRCKDLEKLKVDVATYRMILVDVWRETKGDRRYFLESQWNFLQEILEEAKAESGNHHVQ